MIFRLHYIAAIVAAVVIAPLLLLPTSIDAAAGYPLIRDSMVYHPLSCNSQLDSADCSSTSLESIIAAHSSSTTNTTTTNNNNEILIPCGTCAHISTSDGSTLDISSYSILNIEGKLLVPSSVQATLRTRGIFIQGELQIDPPTALNGLRVQLVGTDDVVFVPNEENAEKCAVGGCNEGSKPVVVAGGRLNVRGDNLTTSPTCKTWTTIKDADTTNPILPNHPNCMFDGSLLDSQADGTFESSTSTTGFQRYRWGSIKIESESDALDGTTNTYLHNYGRSNVKDGLQINLGDYNNCAMKNRMYRMSFKYRLHTPNTSSSHSPVVQLNFQDRNPRTISYGLPESGNGTWAEGSFDFLSYDLKEKEIASVKITWPTDESTSDADYDDISILPILVNPEGTPNVFYVDTDVAQCWSSKVGTELLITTNEIGSLNGGWDEEDVAVITSVDTVTGAITVNEPLAHYKTTEMQDARFATEVAILHRSTTFEAVEDNVDEPWIGGHSVIKHTLVPQVLSGVAFENFGQQGRLGRYPIHFHMAGDHPNSIVSKNLVRNSKQRCIVIHGTDSVLVEENVAYDTVGHCFINENGVEENIRFFKNLGAKTKRQPEERRIGDPLESDHRAYTFWFTNANVFVEGNVAAGADLGGFWYETFEQGPHGPYAGWPEYADFNPKTRPLGSFRDNVAHSSRERGIRMYEPGYKPNEEFTFYNTRSYKNWDHGIFIHGVQLMTLDGGVFADNKVGVRNFNARTIFKNLEFIVTSDLVRERNPGNCDSKAGLQEKINPGWGEGSILENVTFSGINEGYYCDQKGFEFYHLLGPKRFIGNTFLSGVSAGPGTNQEDVVRIECRWEDDPYNIENILVEDFDGTVGLTGMPGFYVSDSVATKAFITGAECVQHPRGCAQYCNGVCLRNVEVTTDACGANCFNYTMRVSDGMTSFDYPLHVDQADDDKHAFEAVLPKGQYEVSFYDQDGALDLIEPADVKIKLGDIPRCANHLVLSDFVLKTRAPTPNPTTTPLQEPLYSDTIIAPLDPTQQFGSLKWTSDPQKVISGKIVTYSLYMEDQDLPAFTVTPHSQHSCSIVQGLKLYTSPTGSSRDPKQYKIEGRFDVHDEWTVIQEGPISLPSGRNVADEDVSSALYFATVELNNVNVYREYRVWLLNSDHAYWARVGAVQFTGYFASCGYIMSPPTAAPSPSPTAFPTPLPSHLPTAQPTQAPTNLPTPQPTVGIDGLAVNTIVYPSTLTRFGCIKVTRLGRAVDPTTEKFACEQNHSEPNGFIMAPAHGKMSIATEMRLYTANNCPDCDCVEYKLDGRVDSASPWNEISSGTLPWESKAIGRNARGLPIVSTFESGDNSLSYTSVALPTSSASYLEYKFICVRTRSELSSKFMLGTLELAGYLLG